MARGKFNKRGGGKRVDAQSAQEIEQRNQRLAEFEEERAKRRAEAEEEDGEEEEGDDATEEAGNASSSKPKSGAPPKAPVQETSEADHKRNLAKLEAVRKRRAVAEKKRTEQEAMEKQIEEDRKQKAAAFADENDSDDDEDDAKKKKKKNKKADIPKLSKIEIKKMKPAVMKDALKLRGLEIQGNAKVLTKRLVDYEEAR